MLFLFIKAGCCVRYTLFAYKLPLWFRNEREGKEYDSEKKSIHTLSTIHEKRKIIPFLEGIILL